MSPRSPGRRKAGPRLVRLTPVQYRKLGYTVPVWFIRDRIDGRQVQRSTGTDDIGRAEERLASYIAEKVDRTRDAIRGGRHPAEIAVTDILAIYGEDVAPGTADPARIGYAIDALVPFWTGKSVAQVRGSTCRRYARQREGRGIGPGTIRRELGALQAAGRYCEQEGIVDNFPAQIWKPAEPPGKDRWLTRDEAARLLRSARKFRRTSRYMIPFILLTLYCGQRKGATLSLQWVPNVAGGWCDLDHDRFDFRRGGEAETAKRRAHMPVHHKVKWLLRRQRRITRRYVIERVDGNRLADIKKGFGEIVDDAGLVDVTPHTLIHTCCTWLMRDGIDPSDGARWTGKTVQTFERKYAHHHPDFLQHIANPTRNLHASSVKQRQ